MRTASAEGFVYVFDIVRFSGVYPPPKILYINSLDTHPICPNCFIVMNLHKCTMQKYKIELL